MNTKNLTVTLAIALSLSLSSHAGTLEKQQATKAVLDAMFSMDVVRPEGVDLQASPKGFDGASAGESELIEFFARKKRLGADFNGYRHLGTPLHHAIRSGLLETTRWLLRNGADPGLRIRDVNTQALYPAPDALGVAVSVSAWELMDDLRRHPAYKKMPADDQARATWPYAMDSADKASMLLRERVPLPNFSTTADLANALLLQSLCFGQHRLALALLRQTDAPAQPRFVRQIGTSCDLADNSKLKTFVTFPVGEWKAVEARLQWPVLPFLAGQAQTAAQAAQLLSAGLQLPWNDPVATSQYVAGAMRAPQPAAPVLLHAIPANALQTALRDREFLMSWWLAIAADWPLPDLSWALAQVDSVQLTERLSKAAGRWRYSQHAGSRAKGTKDHRALDTAN